MPHNPIHEIGGGSGASGGHRLDLALSSSAVRVESLARSASDARAAFATVRPAAAQVAALSTAVARVTRSLEVMARAVPAAPAEAQQQAAASASAVSAPAAGAGNAGAAAGELAQQIRAALASALAPVGQVVARLGDQFNRVGGTVTLLAERIDSKLRLDVTRAAVARAQELLKTGFESATAKAAEDLGRVDRALLRWGPSVGRAIAAVSALKLAIAAIRPRADIANVPLDKLARNTLAAPIAGAARLVGKLTGIAPAARAGTAAINGGAGAIRRFGAEVAVAFGLFGLVYKGVQFIKGGIGAAGNLNETINKTRAILGDASPAVEAFADDLVSRFGLVKQTTLDAASSFAGLGKGLGKLRGADLSKFSNDFTLLAADLGSFANLDFEESSKAILIGLSGEVSDTLKRLGVVVNETTVKQYALAHGIARSGQALSEQQKVLARAGVITEGLADASGDLGRTIGDGLANPARRLGGTIQGLATSIGDALLPTVQAAVGHLTRAAGAISGAFEGNRGAVESFATDCTAGVNNAAVAVSDLVGIARQVPAAFEALTGGGSTAFGSAIAGAAELAGIAIRNLPDIFDIAGLKIYEVVSNMGAAIGTIPANLKIAGDYIAGNWSKLIIDAMVGVSAAILNTASNVGTLLGALADAASGKGFHPDFKPLLAGFKITADALPELVKPALISMAAEIDAKVTEIGAREAARAAAIEARAKAAGGGGGAAAKVAPAAAAEVDPKLAAEAKAIFDKTRTPLEKFGGELAKIDELVAAKQLDPATGLRAIAAARKDLDESGPKKVNVGAFELGSKEARSAVLEARGQRGKDDALRTLNKTSEGQLKAQGEALTVLQAIARGVSGGVGGSILPFPIGN